MWLSHRRSALSFPFHLLSNPKPSTLKPLNPQPKPGLPVFLRPARAPAQAKTRPGSLSGNSTPPMPSILFHCSRRLVNALAVTDHQTKRLWLSSSIIGLIVKTMETMHYRTFPLRASGNADHLLCCYCHTTHSQTPLPTSSTATPRKQKGKRKHGAGYTMMRAPRICTSHHSFVIAFHPFSVSLTTLPAVRPFIYSYIHIYICTYIHT